MIQVHTSTSYMYILHHPSLPLTWVMYGQLQSFSKFRVDNSTIPPLCMLDDESPGFQTESEIIPEREAKMRLAREHQLHPHQPPLSRNKKASLNSKLNNFLMEIIVKTKTMIWLSKMMENDGKSLRVCLRSISGFVCRESDEHNNVSSHQFHGRFSIIVPYLVMCYLHGNLNLCFLHICPCDFSLHSVHHSMCDEFSPNMLSYIQQRII